MSLYDYGFGIAILLLFATEFTALAKEHGETLTSKLVSWMKAKKILRRRVMVGVFIGWLFYHFVFQSF